VAPAESQALSPASPPLRSLRFDFLLFVSALVSVPEFTCYGRLRGELGFSSPLEDRAVGRQGADRGLIQPQQFPERTPRVLAQ